MPSGIPKNGVNKGWFEKGGLFPNKGKSFSEEHKRKISKTLQGHFVSEKTRKRVSESNKKRKCSEETKRKRSESMRGRKRPPLSESWRNNISKGRIGKYGNENHWNWQGGITPINQKIRGSLEYKLWEDSVKSIDNWRCQKCGELRISKLVAHHIFNFAKYIELRFALNNGITFCRDCHKEFHKKYGIKNNTREQVEEFIRTS